jgi:hypothetical protein
VWRSGGAHIVVGITVVVEYVRVTGVVVGIHLQHVSSS